MSAFAKIMTWRVTLSKVIVGEGIVCVNILLGKDRLGEGVLINGPLRIFS